MTDAVLENAVAGHHHERMCQVLLDHFFRIGECRYEAALPPVFVERLCVETLARGNPEHVLVIEPNPFAEAGIENGGLDARHASDVGIRLDSDVNAALACCFDDRNCK